jgi:hypothetical protein
VALVAWGMGRLPGMDAVLTTRGWMVSVPPTMSPDGQRRRRYFSGDDAGKKKAEKFAAAIKAAYHKGERGGLLRPAEAVMAAEAIRILAPTGLSLVEAARQALERWQAHEGSEETFEQRWLAFTAKMEAHWRPRYERDMGKIPRWVPAAFMKRRVAEITPGVLRAAVMAGGAKAEATIQARETRIRSVLAGRGGKRKAVKVALLSREELARLKWEARKDPAVRRVVGLLLFAGIRPAVEDGEITRLEWEAVGKTEIYVGHEVSKTGSDRHIPLGRRLRWWLRGHPAAGPVTPPNWKRKYEGLRRAAGIGAGQDLTRHTFASHYLAVHGEQETKQAMGHTAGSDTLLRHYRRAVTKAQGLRYFGVVADRST